MTTITAVTEAGLAMLASVGFSVNKTVSTGHVDWLGSILVLNKNKEVSTD